MGRPKSDNTDQLVVRVPAGLRERLKALTASIAPAGMSATMTDVVRVALLRGVEALEAEQAAPSTKPRRK